MKADAGSLKKQSYERQLQRQRCKNLRRHGSLVRFERQECFILLEKTL
jgi:hypothetical protein